MLQVILSCFRRRTGTLVKLRKSVQGACLSSVVYGNLEVQVADIEENARMNEGNLVSIDFRTRCLCNVVYDTLRMTYAGEYVVKVNTFGRNSDVRLDWDGVRKLTELEVETWFEETRRVSRLDRKG